VVFGFVQLCGGTPFAAHTRRRPRSRRLPHARVGTVQTDLGASSFMMEFWRRNVNRFTLIGRAPSLRWKRCGSRFRTLFHWNIYEHLVLDLTVRFCVPREKAGAPSMNSQEELVGCLWLLTVALTPNKARQLSLVRDGDAPSFVCADGSLAVDNHHADKPAVKPRFPALRLT
jgi:hypothetical protein